MGSKDRSYQVVTLVALVVAVLGLSVGFAAFSNTLTIKSSAEVTPSQNQFNIDLSGAASSEVTTITPTLSPATGGPSGDNATVDNTGTNSAVIQNLHATFTEPGQSVTYTLYARNVGQYLAYLNSINFGNATGGSSFKVCTAGEGTTATLVSSACEGISLTLSVGSLTDITANQTGISGHSLAAGGNEEITVTIAYAAGSARADGDFTVAFGDIVLTYDSVD